jgi:hypothetical protein
LKAAFSKGKLELTNSEVALLAIEVHEVERAAVEVLQEAEVEALPEEEGVAEDLVSKEEQKL